MRPLPRQVWFKWDGQQSETINVKRIGRDESGQWVSYTVGDGCIVYTKTLESFEKSFGRNIEQSKEIFEKD